MSLAAIAVTGVFAFSVAALVVTRAYCYTAKQYAEDATAAVAMCAEHGECCEPAPLAEAEVRRIVREEIATEGRRSMARLRAMSGLSLKGDDALLKGDERFNDQYLGRADVQVERPEVVVELQQAQPVDQLTDRPEFVGNVGQLRQTHESSPLVGEFSAPTVGERPVAGVQEAPATAPADGGVVELRECERGQQ